MFGQISDLSAHMTLRRIAAAACCAAALAMPSDVWSQQQVAPQQPPPAAAIQPAPPQPERGNPGFIEEVGKALKNSASGLKDAATGLTSRLPSAQGTLDGINSGTKGVADSLTNITPSLSAQSLVAGRAICPAAANGAPDCKAASDNLCKEKGYKEGRSVDIETAKKCSVQAYLSGGGACQTENFVTRAVCQ